MNETKIAQLRKARGWTQERLASESGVAVRTIQRLEAGNDSNLETLSLIANALDVQVRELFATVEHEEFETAADGLDARRNAQQERRDSTTHRVSRDSRVACTRPAARSASSRGGGAGCVRGSRRPRGRGLARPGAGALRRAVAPEVMVRGGGKAVHRVGTRSDGQA